MKVLKTLAPIEGTNRIDKIDTIEHEGKFWLVPQWLDIPAEGWTMPARIILLDTLRHQRLEPGGLADFLLNDPLPKAVLEGHVLTEQAKQYVVVDKPPIRFRGGSGLQ